MTSSTCMNTSTLVTQQSNGTLAEYTANSTCVDESANSGRLFFSNSDLTLLEEDIMLLLTATAICSILFALHTVYWCRTNICPKDREKNKSFQIPNIPALRKELRDPVNWIGFLRSSTLLTKSLYLGFYVPFYIHGSIGSQSACT